MIEQSLVEGELNKRQPTNIVFLCLMFLAMSLIEGIGDEVLHFFIIVFLLVVAAIAWWSTRISERPLIRTVLILERQQPRQVSGQAVPTPSAPTRDEADKPEEAESSEIPAEVIETQPQQDGN